MPFKIIRADITNIEAEAIVNSANHTPITNQAEIKGTDRAIHKAAGFNSLLQARMNAVSKEFKRKDGIIDYGKAIITDSCNLKQKGIKCIIHAVAPIWHGGNKGEYDRLGETYKNALELALKEGCSIVALPLIASGINNLPLRQCLKIAFDSIIDFLFEHENSAITVILVVLNRDIFEFCEKIFPNVKNHIDEEKVKATLAEEYDNDLSSLQKQQVEKAPVHDYGRSFIERFNELIRKKGLEEERILRKVFKDSDISDRVKRDIRDPLKIKTYRSSKATAVSLGLAMRLTLKEMEYLLQGSNIALNPADPDPFDSVIISVLNQDPPIYDIDEVNRRLEKSGSKISLGSN